jgi:hypothetical protein
MLMHLDVASHAMHAFRIVAAAQVAKDALIGSPWGEKCMHFCDMLAGTWGVPWQYWAFWK